MSETIRVVKVVVLPKWLRKGDGDYIGSQEINGVERKLRMSWRGINTSHPEPAYFQDETGQWFRIAWKDINTKIERRL